MVKRLMIVLDTITDEIIETIDVDSCSFKEKHKALLGITLEPDNIPFNVNGEPRFQARQDNMIVYTTIITLNREVE